MSNHNRPRPGDKPPRNHWRSSPSKTNELARHLARFTAESELWVHFTRHPQSDAGGDFDLPMYPLELLEGGAR